MRDHKNRVIDFGGTADDYDRFRPGFPESFFDRLAEDGWIGAGDRALDLGTGTGSLALGFAARGLATTGLDIAPSLLGVARRAAQERGLSVRFVEGRAEATDQEDASFDLVSAGQCWWWFDSDAAIKETIRILAPGGRLLICSFTYVPLAGSVAGRTEEMVLEHNPGWNMAAWRGVYPEHVEALDRDGFQQVESYSYVVDVPFSHEAWRGRVRASNGVGATMNVADVRRFDADLGGLLSREFPGDLTVPHRVFATSGIRPRRSDHPATV